jgi:hypothetical protein
LFRGSLLDGVHRPDRLTLTNAAALNSIAWSPAIRTMRTHPSPTALRSFGGAEHACVRQMKLGRAHASSECPSHAPDDRITHAICEPAVDSMRYLSIAPAANSGSSSDAGAHYFRVSGRSVMN